MVERWGIEPQIPDCRSGVFPLALPPHGFLTIVTCYPAQMVLQVKSALQVHPF